MIIIKSQSGSIEDCARVFCANVGKTRIGTVIGGTAIELGEYESKERAKEVMDEIEKRIRENYANEQTTQHYVSAMQESKQEMDIQLELSKLCERLEKHAIYTMPND